MKTEVSYEVDSVRDLASDLRLVRHGDMIVIERRYSLRRVADDRWTGWVPQDVVHEDSFDALATGILALDGDELAELRGVTTDPR